MSNHPFKELERGALIAIVRQIPDDTLRQVGELFLEHYIAHDRKEPTSAKRYVASELGMHINVVSRHLTKVLHFVESYVFNESEQSKAWWHLYAVGSIDWDLRCWFYHEGIYTAGNLDTLLKMEEAVRPGVGSIALESAVRFMREAGYTCHVRADTLSLYKEYTMRTPLQFIVKDQRTASMLCREGLVNAEALKRKLDVAGIIRIHCLSNNAIEAAFDDIKAAGLHIRTVPFKTAIKEAIDAQELVRRVRGVAACTGASVEAVMNMLSAGLGLN